MATKLYTNDIDKTIDWGGDAQTGGLPVSGEKVQKFIKDTLAKKFGFMYFDKDSESQYETSDGGTIYVRKHTVKKPQYLIFADEKDFAVWAADPDNNQTVILGNFDAPAPATIEVENATNRNNTILLVDADSQIISFEYYINQSAGGFGGGEMLLNISITNGNNINNLPRRPLGILNTDGTPGRFEFKNFGSYLSEGTNIIKFTLTSVEFNVSRSIDFQFNVVSFIISSDFDYTHGFALENGYLPLSVTCIAQGQKYIRIFVDNESIFGYMDEEKKKPNGKYIGGDSSASFEADAFLLFDNFKSTWAKPGQHNIQFYCYIQNADGTEIYSKTLYYDFVLTETEMNNAFFILFHKEVEGGKIIPNDEKLVISTEQYNDIEVQFGAYNNKNFSPIVVDINLQKEGESEPFSTKQKKCDNGSINTFQFTIQEYGNVDLKLSITVDGVTTEAHVGVEVGKSSADVNKITDHIILDLSALNRSNDEPDEQRKVWEYRRPRLNQEDEVIRAIFDKHVLWNDQCGWKDNALVLDNATVEIPMNIFNNYNIQNGLTFEIDFETANVQNDDAVIMEYGNPNASFISIKACSAEMKSEVGKSIKTNYKDNSRQKIQFIYAGQNEATNDLPHLYYLVVNGILDRVVKFDDTVSGGAQSFVIGNKKGEVTIKIYNIRIYNKALSLDQCISNYVADSGKNILDLFNKNNVYAEDGKTIDVNKVLANGVPVMTIFGDITTSISKLFNKKTNVPVDVLYQDPTDPYGQFDFFAADCWMCNQGTSSMNYPRRNLRLYFNKEANGTTLRGYGDDENYKYNTRVYPGLTNMEVISQLQQRKIDDVFNVTVGDKVYHPLCNKKWKIGKEGTTLKDDGNLEDLKNVMCEIKDEEKARRLWHSGIKLYTFKQKKDGNTGEPIDDYEYKKVKSFNSDLYKMVGNQNQFQGCYVYGAYTHFKAKDLYTDRWTIKCDYAESSMTHNAGIGRLWGSVLENIEIADGGYINRWDPETNKINRFSTKNACRTNAQIARDEYEASTGHQYGDIRTSCDGYPIVIINYPRKRDKNNNVISGEFEVNPIFLGLYNIMTDKGSTPLFGFEDLKDDDGKVIFDASKVECWECLQNGSSLAAMYDIVTDNKDGSTQAWNKNKDASIETNRLIWKTYEARWPDNDNWNLTKTNNLETLIRFVNFCKDAVKVTVAGRDAYNISDFSQIEFDKTGDYTEQAVADDMTKLRELIRRKNESIIKTNLWNGKIYIEEPAKSYKEKTSNFYKKDSEGNYILNPDKTNQFLDPNDENDYAELVKQVHGRMWYKITFGAGQAATTGANAMSPAYSEADDDSTRIAKIVAVFNSDTPSIYQQTLDYSDVSYEEVDTIVAGQENKYFYYDSGYDRTDISKEINTTPMKDEVYSGLVYTFDGKRVDANGNRVNEDAYVRVYLDKGQGTNSFNYIDEMGKTTTFIGGTNGDGFLQETCSGNVGTRGTSFKGKTKLEYFSDKKYEHFDVWKLAAYYIYLMRFAAVDQVIKNTMMTTEDGQHYYFINYDNDTIMGVRNDGHLIFDWQIDRNSYDNDGQSYAYAGFSSVLWNCLEADQDFMNKVQIVANAMVNSGALTYDIALDMFNVKQAGTWSERLYNNSEMYKYIGTFNDMDNKEKPSYYNPYQNANYLPFLQGSRKSHREWWLRHRFDYYDSKWSAGEYATSFMRVLFNGLNASNGNPKSIIGIISASKFYYTAIQDNTLLIGCIKDNNGNNISDNTFAELKANEEGIINTQMSLAIGNPLRILGIHKAKEINLYYQKSTMVSELLFTGNSWDNNNVKVLNIGGDNDSECAIGAIQGIEKLKSLEVLNIRGCKNLSNPNISTLLNLKVYDARTTMITSFEPATGVHMQEVHLPSTIRSIKLVDAKFDEEAFDYKPSKILNNVVISNVEGIDIVDFLVKWNDEIDSDNLTKAIKNTYKCTLSFDKIKLPSVIQHENGEEENSIVWLNRIKKEFGADINGKPNFNITKGVIEIQGKLEEEQYNLLTNEVYQGTQINVWDDNFFKSVSAAHFDATETSIFIRVKVNGEVIDKENFKAIHVVAGAQIDFASIVFPISNERTIIYRPYHILKTGSTRQWSLSTLQQNSYIEKFDGKQSSSFTFEPSAGTAKMELKEYTEFDTNHNLLDAITMPIGIYEKANADAPEVQLNRNNKIEIVMAKAIKPQKEDFEVYKNNSTKALLPKGDEVDNATMPIEYRLEAAEGIVTNVKMKQVSVSISSTDNCGTVKAELKEYDEESGKAGKQYILVTYLPKISNVDKLFNIDTVVTLDDKSSSQFTISFAVKLITKNITDINLSAIDGASYKIEGDGNNYKFEEYIKLTNESTKSYKFNVSLGEYNVGIANMTATMLDAWTDITLNSTKVDNIITQIELFVPSLANSFDDSFTVQLKVIDEFNNTVTKDINVKIGLYYPDQVKIFKEEFKDENGSGDRESLNIDILMGDKDTKYFYKVHIYSLINNTRYFWALNGETKEQYIDTNNRLQENTYIVTSNKVVLNTFNSSNVTFNINLGNAGDIIKLNTDSLLSNPLIRQYEILDNGITGTEKVSIDKCSVNIPNHTCELIGTSTFEVARNGASGKDGVWQNLKPGIYIMDSKKRFFIPSNYNYDQDNPDDVAIIYVYEYVYEDNNIEKIGKKNIAIDHRLLLGDKKTFYQWPSTSTFAISNTSKISDNFGFFKDKGGKTSCDPLWNYLNPTTNDLGEKFEQMAKYYAFICAIGSPDNINHESNKVLIRVNGKTKYNMADYGNDYKAVAKRINNKEANEIKLDYTFEDEDMIFYYVNRYNQEYGLSYVCRPLSYAEINKVIYDFSNNPDLKDTFNYICKNIFELTGVDKEFEEAFNAIIDIHKHYVINKGGERPEPKFADDAGKITTNIEDENFNVKLFWILDTITYNDGKPSGTPWEPDSTDNKERLSKFILNNCLYYEAYYDNNNLKDNKNYLVGQQNYNYITKTAIGSENKLYCIFGPHLP